MKKILFVFLLIISVGAKGQVVVYGSDPSIVYHSWSGTTLNCSYTEKGSTHYFINNVLYCSATRLPVPGQSQTTVIPVHNKSYVNSNGGGNIINDQGYNPNYFERNSWSVDNGKYYNTFIPVQISPIYIPRFNFGNVINSQGYNPWLFGDNPGWGSNYYYPNFSIFGHNRRRGW